MLRWLRLRRQKAEQIEAEADALIAGFGIEAYAEARLRARHANDFAGARYWGRVADAIARKACDGFGRDPEAQAAALSATRLERAFPPALRTAEAEGEGPVADGPGAPSEGAFRAPFRLQFLGLGPDGGRVVLSEAPLAEAGVADAIRNAGRLEWPPLAIGFRLFDADGREVLAGRSETAY